MSAKAKIAVVPTADRTNAGVEAFPTLSERERAELVASLEEATAQIAAGRFTTHEPQRFVARLMRVRDEALRRKAASKSRV